MKKPVKMSFIADAERFLKKDLNHNTLIRNNYSKAGKVIYYGFLAIVCIIFSVPFFIYVFDFSLYFLLLLLLLVPILFFAPKKSNSENNEALAKHEITTPNFKRFFGNFKDDFGELQYLLLAKYVKANHLTHLEFEEFYTDFIERHIVKPYKWWYSKIIVLPLLAWVASSGAAYFLENEILKTDKENFLSIIQISLSIIITVPFMEFNLFKLRADHKNSDNLRDKRFLKAFKLRYFGDDKTPKT